jgi:hypothetical protein
MWDCKSCRYNNTFINISQLSLYFFVHKSHCKLVPEDYLFVVDLFLAFRDFQVVLQQEKETFVGTLIWGMDEGAIDIKEIGKLKNFVSLNTLQTPFPHRTCQTLHSLLYSYDMKMLGKYGKVEKLIGENLLL